MLQVTMMPTSDLIPYALNAKQHPDKQVAQIAASISEFGMNDPVAVWHNPKGEPIIVEGHGRVLALQKLHVEECPVITLDNLSDEQRQAYTLIHNKLTMDTGFDPEVLEQALNQIPNIDMSDFDLEIPDVNTEDWEDALDKLPDGEQEIKKITLNLSSADYDIIMGAINVMGEKQGTTKPSDVIPRICEDWAKHE